MSARGALPAALLLLLYGRLLTADGGACRALGSVCDGGGRSATNALPLAGRTWRHVFAAAQPGGVGTSVGGAWTHESGFLRAVDLRQPWLDTDGDGVSDEWDTDNDADGLPDWDEVTGAAFDPGTPTAVNVRDSDGDGASDGDEASAGTDPTDPQASFRIAAVQRRGTDTRVTWVGRADRTYQLLAVEVLPPPGGFATVTVTNVAGGSPPWFFTTNTVTDTTAQPARFYRVATDPGPPD